MMITEELLTPATESNPFALSILNLSKRLAAKGLSLPQYCLLGQLPRSGKKGVPMTVVASAMEITNAAITGLADRMELSGFIRRVNDTKDRRVILLTPTAKGLNALNQFEAEGLSQS